MEASPDENADAALPPMALLATLQTAATVWDGVRERRAGRDPAGQEPAGRARAYLSTAARELTRLHMQLLMAKVQAERDVERRAEREIERSAREEGSPASSESHAPTHLTTAVRRFDLLMKLRRTGRLLHGAHQRLLSLYPAVSEELVEEARRCQGTLTALREAGDEAFGEALSVFLQRLLSFAAWLEREL